MQVRCIKLAHRSGRRSHRAPYGETLTDEYTRLNPKQKVPLLVDGTFRFSESVTICRYLIASYPGGNIAVPSTPAERAREDGYDEDRRDTLISTGVVAAL